jgi:lipopolysaccharide export LptBFGC system permease protein LptF
MAAAGVSVAASIAGATVSVAAGIAGATVSVGGTGVAAGAQAASAMAATINTENKVNNDLERIFFFPPQDIEVEIIYIQFIISGLC